MKKNLRTIIWSSITLVSGLLTGWAVGMNMAAGEFLTIIQNMP